MRLELGLGSVRSEVRVRVGAFRVRVRIGVCRGQGYGRCV